MRFQLLFRLLADKRYRKRLNAVSYFTGMIDAVMHKQPLHVREHEARRLMACHSNKVKSKYLPHQNRRERERRAARLALQRTEG